MTRRAVLDNLQHIFGEVMGISDVAARREQMLEVLLNKEQVSENTCLSARKMLDKLTSENLLDGKGSHDVVLAIIYYYMMKHGECYTSLTPLAKKYGFTPNSVNRHYHFVAQYD